MTSLKLIILYKKYQIYFYHDLQVKLRVHLKFSTNNYDFYNKNIFYVFYLVLATETVNQYIIYLVGKMIWEEDEIKT